MVSGLLAFLQSLLGGKDQAESAVTMALAAGLDEETAEDQPNMSDEEGGSGEDEATGLPLIPVEEDVAQIGEEDDTDLDFDII